MYNTVKPSHNQTLLLWKNRQFYIFLVCLCSLSYPACKATVTYYILTCGLYVSTIFFHIISQRPTFERKLLNITSVFRFFSTTFFLKRFIIPRRTERYIIINAQRSSHKVPVILVKFLMKLELYWQVFEKNTQNQISYKSVQWDPSHPMRTDGHTWWS
jgi:hypothetical protein